MFTCMYLLEQPIIAKMYSNDQHRVIYFKLVTESNNITVHESPIIIIIIPCILVK